MPVTKATRRTKRNVSATIQMSLHILLFIAPSFLREIVLAVHPNDIRLCHLDQGVGREWSEVGGERSRLAARAAVPDRGNRPSPGARGILLALSGRGSEPLEQKAQAVRCLFSAEVDDKLLVTILCDPVGNAQAGGLVYQRSGHKGRQEPIDVSLA